MTKWEDVLKTPESGLTTTTDSPSLFFLDSAEVFEHPERYADKLFFDDERATYTFLQDAQVFCLHYDLNRQSVFLNGHRLSGADMTEALGGFLAQFKKSLIDHQVNPRLLRAFDLQVSQIFSGYTIASIEDTQP